MTIGGPQDLRAPVEPPGKQDACSLPRATSQLVGAQVAFSGKGKFPFFQEPEEEVSQFSSQKGGCSERGGTGAWGQISCLLVQSYLL